MISHYNVQPVLDVLAAADGADLWSVASAIERIVDEVRPTLPRGSTIVMRGQVASMRTSFRGLGLGLWISRSIVERHGGGITAARTAEGFTRFTLTLPTEPAA